MLKVLGCIATAHDLRLVVVAGLVCLGVSILACSLFAYAVKAARESRGLWLGAAGVTAGTGFWATHFIAMLSFKPGLPTAYDPVMLLVAWVVSVLAAGLAFMLLAMSRRWWSRLFAGSMFGLAGAMMHYTAMGAFRTVGEVRADPAYVVVSILAGGAVVALASVWVARMNGWRDRVLGGLALTVSICTLHFVGMTALTITPDPRVVLGAGLLTPVMLAVCVVVTLLLAVGMAALAALIHTRTSEGALARLQDVIEAMPASLAYYDADDRAVIWNRRYAERSNRNGKVLKPGMPYRDCLEASVAAGLYEDAIGREAEWIEEHMAERASAFESRTLEQRRDEHWLRFEERRTKDGGLVSVATDVTDLKLSSQKLSEALERAEAADRAKTDFLSNLSHELRTPLNGVVGLTDVLASTDLTPAQRQVVDAILASAQGLTDQISSILDFTELQSGAMALEAQPFDPAATAREAVELFDSAARAKGLELQVELACRPGLQVLGDRARLRQVLISLLSNAVKFTETGHVALGLEVEESDEARRLRFSVADTGVGFDGAQADRLFAWFEQGDGSMTRKHGGMGLGLAMSRQIAELMGAELTANSLPGHGATFTFAVSLPAAPDLALAAEPVPAPVEAPEEVEDDHPLRVLLADDHPTNRQVVELILGAAAADISSVENGAEAVEAFTHGRYDLVLMDLQMPVMDGLTAMKAIRDFETSKHLPRTPMIALTANVLAEHVAASMAAGADRHVSKPITAARLLDEIGKVFERHTAANDLPDAA